MKVETIGGAALATLNLLVVGFIALYQTEGINSYADIPEAAWVALIGGAISSFILSYQTISTRRGIAKVAGK